MKETEEQRFTAKRKAKIALQATDAGKIRCLAQKHNIDSSEIEGWVHQLHERAELLFSDKRAANQTETIHNHAALLHTILEASSNGILVFDLDRNIITFNQKCLEMWKIPRHIVAMADMAAALQHVLTLLVDAEGFMENTKKMYAYPEKEIHDIIALKDGRFFERHSVPYRVENKIVGRITNFIDITAYKKTEEKLTRFSNLLRSINKNIEEGILRSTPKQGLVYVNDAFVTMFGYASKEEVLAAKPDVFYADQGHRQKLIKILKQQGHVKGREVLYKRKDGSTFWGMESSVMMVGEQGIYIDAVVSNIDDRKKNEEQIERSLREKEVLLGEIHHRVKNNLAVISGLLYLQADQTEDLKARDALKESQSRINSMALIHELLYDNQTFSSINPKVYIQQLIAHISANLCTGESTITTKIEADSFDLELSTAIPCALIINELITNAYKHAFKGRKEGMIKIIFLKEAHNGYRLEVSDDGVGLPQNFTITAKRQYCLGLSLVKTLTHQLKGELNFKNKNGAAFIITFPDE